MKNEGQKRGTMKANDEEEEDINQKNTSDHTGESTLFSRFEKYDNKLQFFLHVSVHRLGKIFWKNYGIWFLSSLIGGDWGGGGMGGHPQYWIILTTFLQKSMHQHFAKVKLNN